MKWWHWWTAVAIGLVLSWWASSHPGDELPGAEWWGRFDKLVHASAWAVLAGFATGGGLARGWRARVAVAVAVGLGLVWGCIDEWHQSYVPHRSSDVADVCADLVGSLVGSCVLVWVYRRRRDGDHPTVPGDATDARS